MNESLLNILFNIYEKYLFFSDQHSFIRKEIDQLNEIYDSESYLKFIQSSSILNKNEVNILQEFLDIGSEFTEENKQELLNYFNVFDNPINKIKIVQNILPFNLINNLIIDKSLLKNLDDFYLLRKEIIHIENFIWENKTISEVNNLSIMIMNNDTNSGEYDKIKKCIKLYSNNLNPSSLYHEFFHLIDNELSKKYLLNDLFSNLNIPTKELKLLNNFISNLEHYITSDNNENFNLYYSKYLGKNPLLEIKSLDDIKFKIKNLNYLGFKLIVKKEKEELFNNLAEELYSHFQYSQNRLNQPKRNLYAIFSDILDLDLPINQKYISKNSEKLARIYQSSFPQDKDSLYPLGSEKFILTNNLNHILQNEIKPLLAHSHTLQNILTIRENFNKKINSTLQLK